MIGRSAFLFLALANLSLSGVGAVQVRNKVNPIRRVVTLLQEMAKKITEEGEQKAAMYENLECYCGTTSQELKTNVKEGSARITDSTSKIQAEEGILVELKTVIKVSQESRVEKTLDCCATQDRHNMLVCSTRFFFARSWTLFFTGSYLAKRQKRKVFAFT